MRNLVQATAGAQLSVLAIAVEKSVTNVDSGEYGQLLLLLQDRGFIDWQDDSGVAMLWLVGTTRDNEIELDVLFELRGLFGNDSVALRRALVDLDFSILDEAAAKALELD